MAIKNKTNLTSTNNSSITDPLNKQNTAARVRGIIQDVIDSTLNSTDIQSGTTTFDNINVNTINGATLSATPNIAQVLTNGNYNDALNIKFAPGLGLGTDNAGYLIFDDGSSTLLGNDWNTLSMNKTDPNLLLYSAGLTNVTTLEMNAGTFGPSINIEASGFGVTSNIGLSGKDIAIKSTNYIFGAKYNNTNAVHTFYVADNGLGGFTSSNTSNKPGTLISTRNTTMAMLSYNSVGLGGNNNVVGGNNNVVSGTTNKILDVASNNNFISGSTNTLSGNSGGNIVSGSTNTLTLSSANSITGLSNSLSASNYNNIGGALNSLTQSGYTTVGGVGNSLYTSQGDLVTGELITMTHTSYNIVGGQGHTIIKSIDNNVNGGSNYLYNSYNNNVIGIFNSLTASSNNNSVSGKGNKVVSSDSNVITGVSQSVVSTTGSFVSGSGTVVNSSDSIIINPQLLAGDYGITYSNIQRSSINVASSQQVQQEYDIINGSKGYIRDVDQSNLNGYIAGSVSNILNSNINVNFINNLENISQSTIIGSQQGFYAKNISYSDIIQKGKNINGVNMSRVIYGNGYINTGIFGLSSSNIIIDVTGAPTNVQIGITNSSSLDINNSNWGVTGLTYSTNITQKNIINKHYYKQTGSLYGSYGSIQSYNITNNATPVTLLNSLSIYNNSSYKVTINAIATDSAGNSKEWSGSGIIKNIGGTTTVVSTITMSSVVADGSMSTATLTVAANNTTDTLDFTATGISSTLINWNAKVDYVYSVQL